jgi:inosine-uridine nucleoside N-ribohydrolase
MGHYLRAHPAGKLLHDPLAAAAAIDPSLFVWSEIEVTYGEGKWGAIAATDTDTFISIGVDRAGFFDLVAG